MSRILISDAPDEQTLAAYQVLLLHARVGQSIQKTLKHVLADTPLIPAEWLLLSTVRDIGRQTVAMSSLANVLGISVPRTTELAASLAAKKLLQQKLSKSDLRQRQLVCTAAGRRLLRKLDRRLKQDIIAWRKPLTEEHFALYLRLLTKLSK